MNLPILIRDEVWKCLKSTDLKFAKEVQQCIKKVEKGQFDFGLRVKKLKGVSQRVWEARINQASRLLFTYRSFNYSDGQVQTYRAIESICVEHDDVSHRAKIIGRNWEGLEIVEVLGDLDLEFDKLDDERQEKIQGWEAEEIKTQSAFSDELLENIKWLILEPEIIESEEEWQNAVESGADLRLLLTPQESNLIKIYGNVLISGSAGTGKTTVGLYRLARTLQMNPSAICLYVAYNPILVKESEEQFKQLWGSSYESLPVKPNFLTIRDLCLNIAKDFKHQLVDYQHFYQRYIKKPESKKYPPFLMWDEIGSIVKGANLQQQTESCLLSEKEYQSLGKMRSGVISKGERHEIYKLAQWYQQYLNNEQLADEIDLVRAAWQITEKENHNLYKLIVCDEVQDLTEIQLEFLVGLIAQGGQILCGGDTNQMISPSGFRWADLTTRLYQKNRKWTKENLSTNFRSTGKLVSLSVKVLNLKFQLLSEVQSPEKVPQSVTGELARLVEASKDNLNQINLGAADAILVRTEKRKQELSKNLETVLIFTIEESKGLEFDTVYLIDFFENSKNLWTDALSSSRKLREQQKPELRLEFNLLYVAITRARRLLNICEVERADLWKRSELTESLIPMSIDKAFNQAQSVDPQDWYKRAVYYRDARLFTQALECAIKSNDNDLMQDIKVEYLVSAHKYIEAAQLLSAMHKHSEAAKLYEKIFDFQQASKAWTLSGDLDNATNCEVEYLVYNCQKREAVKILVEREKYVEAAKLLQELGDFEKATELFLKGDAKELAVACQTLLLKQAKKINIVGNKNKLIQNMESGSMQEDFIESNNSSILSQAFKSRESDDYLKMLESSRNICDFLKYAKNKEEIIAKAIFNKYGTEYIAGNHHINNYHHMENGISLKRQGLYELGIEKYSMFFDESKVGKSWYMTYYGAAKILTLSKQYDLALSSLAIAIELCKITRCADSTYMQHYHYGKITALKNGKKDHEYLSSIKG